MGGSVGVIAGKVMAPLVQQATGGLLQNLAGGRLGNMAGIGDAFQKIAGSVGQIFGGSQGAMGGLGALGQIAGSGMMPNLPLGPFGMPRPGSFGPAHPGGLEGALGGMHQVLGEISQGTSGVFQKLGDLGAKIQGITDQVGRTIGATGGAKESAGVGSVEGGNAQGGQAVSGQGSGDPAGGAPGETALGKAFNAMEDVQKQMDNLKPDDPKYQQKMMQLQQKMQMVQQSVSLVNEMRKAMHDSMMGVVRNIR